MIIKIDSSVVDALADDNNLHVIAFLEDLSRLRMDGFIVVDTTKRVITPLMESERLNPLQRAVFTQISTEITFQLEVIEKYTKRVVFFHQEVSDEHNLEQDIFHIDVAGYIDKKTSGQLMLSRPKLVLENIDDSEIYRSIVSWTINQSEYLSAFHVGFDVVNGGGDTTDRVCQHHHDNGDLVFAVCDSDRKSPSCVFGQTSRKVRSFFESIHKPNCLLVINANEVENLIPIQVLEMVADANQMPAINFLKHASETKPDSYLFYDLKNGFSYEFVYIKDEERCVYWRGIYESYNNETFKSQVNAIHADEQQQRTTLLNRLSSMLPHARRNFYVKQFDGELHEPLRNEWESISQWMLENFLSYKPMRL